MRMAVDRPTVIRIVAGGAGVDGVIDLRAMAMGKASESAVDGVGKTKHQWCQG